MLTNRLLPKHHPYCRVVVVVVLVLQATLAMAQPVPQAFDLARQHSATPLPLAMKTHVSNGSQSVEDT